MVKRPTRVCADFVITFAYGLTPASESAFAMLSARSSAGVFFGTGSVVFREKKKQACVLSRSRQAASGLRRCVSDGIRIDQAGDGFGSRLSIDTAMPIAW